MEDEYFEQVLLKEMKTVFKYLLKIGASKEDAEDITQDTLYKTIKNVNSIQDGKVRAWLFKVSINSYYNLYNRKKAQQPYSLEEVDSIMFLAKSMDDIIVTEESKQSVHGVLKLLKPSYKNLLVLKYLMDLSYREIGDILELSECQVKTYLYRARNSFKNIWEGLNHE